MVQENNTLKINAFSGFMWKFAERLGAQGVSLIVSIVLARLLLPEDYAVVGIVTIFFSFANIIISGGLNTALIQKKDADETDYNTILYISILLSIIIYFLLFFSAPFIAKVYDIPLLTPIIRVMGVTLIVNAVKSILCAYVSSHLQFKKFFFATLIGTVISAFVGIIMAYFGFGAWALITQQMSNSIIDTVILFITTKFRIRFVVSLKRLKSLLNFGWKIFIANVISVLYDEIRPIIIGLKYSAVDLSFYTKGNSFPALINNSVVSTLSAVLFPVMSKIQDSKEAVLDITRKYIRVSSYLIFPMMCGFFAVSESFVKLLLTDKWLPAVPYIQIFCVSYMFNIIHVGNLEAIKAIGRSDVSLILEIIKKFSYFIVILFFVIFAGSPVLLAISSIVNNVIATIINTFPNRKLIGYKYRYQIMDLLPNFIISAIMGVVVLLMGKLPLSVFVVMIIQIVTGVVIYLSLSIITKNKNLEYLLNTVKQFLKK